MKKITSKINKSKSLSFIFVTFSIAVLTFIVFSPSLKCGFTNWDDERFIVQNPLIVNKTVEVKKIFTSILTESDYYPVTIISFAFNYKLCKFDPFGYHLCNLLFHIFNSLLVLIFIFILTKRNLLMASIVALFFAIHPMHVESVTWVTERKDVLFMFFFLIGLICYMFYREKKRKILYVVIIISFTLSCLSKGTAVVFPFILLLIDYLLSNRITKKMLVEKTLFFLISLTFILITYRLHFNNIININIPQKTFMQRILFASYDLLWYIFKEFIPNNLSAFYVYPLKGNIPFAFYLSPFILVICVAAIYFFMRNQKEIIFGFLFYFFSIVLMLQFIPTGNGDFNMADRYNYLPSVGLLFVVAHFANIVWKKKKNFRYLLIGITITVSLVFSFQTFARTKVWLNSETLWTDAINKNPDHCFMGYYCLGDYYQFIKNDIEKALSDYNRTIEINPNYSMVYNNRGLIYFYQHKYELAIKDFNKAIILNPNNMKAYCSRVLNYEKTGQYEIAIREYNKVINASPNYYLTYYNRGVIYLNSKQYDLAIADFTQSIKLNPSYSYAYANRGAIYMYHQQGEKALAEFTSAIEFDSKIAGYWFNRSVIENTLGRKQQAITDALKAKELGMLVDAKYLKELGIN